MKVFICNIEEMPSHAESLLPSHLVSLVAPEEQPATPVSVNPRCHLRLRLHDIVDEMPPYIAPQADHVRTLIDFVRAWPAERPLLIHCIAGISRSTAAALITLCVKAPGRETEAAQRLRAVAPHAQPNRRVVALADGLLDCNGRLLAAREAMGPANGIVRGPLVELALLDGELPRFHRAAMA